MKANDLKPGMMFAYLNTPEDPCDPGFIDLIISVEADDRHIKAMILTTRQESLANIDFINWGLTAECYCSLVDDLNYEDDENSNWTRIA